MRNNEKRGKTVKGVKVPKKKKKGTLVESLIPNGRAKACDVKRKGAALELHLTLSKDLLKKKRNEPGYTETNF